MYANGPREKLEKLKCILHYFKRITTESIESFTVIFFDRLQDLVPNGFITFLRFSKPKRQRPNWKFSRSNLVDLQLSSDAMIEDVPNALQVDFANKYIVRNQRNVKNIDLRID